jgi:hypothetical protein
MNESGLLALVVLIGGIYVFFRNRITDAIKNEHTEKEKELADQQQLLEKDLEILKADRGTVPPPDLDPKEVEKYWRNN